MAQEEKQLLLQVISANLTHGLKAFFVDVDTGIPTQCKILGAKSNELVEIIRIDTNGHEFGRSNWMDVSFLKPYLRPMSSMTKEEEFEYHKYARKDLGEIAKEHFEILKQTAIYSANMMDWLNKNMFDHRGLIPMGIALPAPEGMYK